jgi:acylphosphatase
MLERHQVRFVGRVQGVGFRATTRDIARRCAVTGWVRNEPDGAVLLEVQGEPDAIHQVLTEVRRLMATNIVHAHTMTLPTVHGEHAFVILR